MKRSPLVSVVVPCFNALPLLSASIGSLLKQSYLHCEVILVDDHSTDGGPGFVKSHFRSKKLKILINPINYGPSRTRNVGIKTARGKYIAFFETDMVASPDWIVQAAGFLEKHPGVAAVHSRVFDLRRKKFIQADGMLLIPHTGWVVMRNYGLTRNQADPAISPVIIGSVGTVARAHLLRQIGGFDEALGHKVDDIDMGWRLWLTGFTTVSLPTAVTYHWGAKPQSARPIPQLKSEIYFHRMTRVFLKNYELPNLFRFFPVLLATYLVRATKHLLHGNHQPLVAFLSVCFWTMVTLPDTLKERGIIQSTRRISDKILFQKIMVPGSFIQIWRRFVQPTHNIAHTIFAK